jgi:hypothetical protein
LVGRIESLPHEVQVGASLHHAELTNERERIGNALDSVDHLSKRQVAVAVEHGAA